MGTHRRFATADGSGVFVDVGAPLPIEIEAASLDYGSEDVVHAVTESVVGFDLPKMLRDRDDGLVEEVFLRAELS